MSETNELTVIDSGQCRILTLNRPEKRNALTVGLVDDLRHAIDAAPNAGVRVLVITGEGRSFCSGGDLPSLAALASEGSIAASDAIYTSFHGLVRSLRDSQLPVIAAVNGHALGAGLDLALCADIRIAGDDAVFESTWMKAGLIPGMAGGYRLPRIISAARAADMLLGARRIDAQTALDWGLVNEVVAGSPVDAAIEYAARLAQLSPLALSRTKASMRRSLDEGLDPELAILGAQQGQLLSGSDFQAMASSLAR